MRWSDPTKPTVVDVHPELTRTRSFGVKGTVVYAARYHVISILERTSLDVIGHLGGYTHDIAIHEGWAFYFSYYSSLVVLDISDPRHPDPNPFTTSLHLNIQAPIAAQVHVGIFDVSGRLVRTMGTSMSSTSGTMTWDGRDSEGRDVGAGVYLVRMESESGGFLRRIVKLR